jgi:hypothetical protein
MIATQTKEFLQRLRQGVPTEDDRTFLENARADDLIAELRSVYRLTFQERHIGRKWEVSLARSLRTELVARPIPTSVFVSFEVVQVYISCLMLNIEDNLVTGISRLGRLALRTVAEPTPGLSLTTGRGYKLDFTPDGWSLKRLKKRTVTLTEPFLRNRGWNFDHISRFLPTA